jgi:hypothetical protein
MQDIGLEDTEVINVEIFNENEQADCYMEDGQRVEKTEAGKWEDAPEYVRTL